ncbi:esterase family protein [Embleya sp. NBC_00888]|uniref:alpha/beta hydrolase n=1 Tax=Embleya sp. NBC_00888 TaxID=2975960 RepID=UPI003866FABC|nr:esterase family protein [Embleya sp. NBC_00888]
MTRTLKGLLIAVTLGAIVVLVLRARTSRAADAAEAGSSADPAAESESEAESKVEPGPRAAELPAAVSVPAREQVRTPARAGGPGHTEPAERIGAAGSKSAARSAGSTGAAGSTGGSTSTGSARSTGTSRSAPARAETPMPFAPVEVASAVPAGPEPVRVVEPVVIGADPAPVRRRRGVRSPLGVGLLVLAVVAAGVGGTFAYKGMADDDKQNVASATKVEPSAEPVATSGQPKPAPQKFTKVGSKSGGTLTKTTVAGRRSGVTADVWVWLPPGYDTAANQARSYPVLVAQSALPGVESNSFVDDSVAFLPKLAAAIEAGTVPPYIVVAPELLPYSKQEADAGQTAAKDTECSDVPNRPKMATFHNDDVREAVLSTYRATPDRASWALIGDGSGGLCAVKYALQYPQYYAAAVSLSGRTTLKSPLWDADSATKAARTANDPAKLLDAKPDVQILLSGHTGGTGSEFAAKAKAPTTVKAIAGAGGTSGDIARQVPEALVFLGKNTRNPAA